MTPSSHRSHLIDLVFGQMAAQVVAAAARLRLADEFDACECTSPDLAVKLGTDTVATTRFCRTLTALGLLTETKPESFQLTMVGALLRTDREDSLNEFVQMFTEPLIQAAWHQLDTALLTGNPSFDTIFGAKFFDHLTANPELSARFNTMMRQGGGPTARILPHCYDFSRFHTVADIGGGDGTLLAEILRAHTDVRGILFDTATGIAQSHAVLSDANITSRCTVFVGDFFNAVPAGADLYLLKSILHDWDDDRATSILTHIRQVLPATGRLLIMEPVLPDVVDSSIPDTVYLSDLNMLVNNGGRERTRTDFELLCRRSGFTIVSIGKLPSPEIFSLIEARNA
ncbi:methyltransferase [Nocardia brasiliensis]|uniref:methyltransferase n=1 Tax=Nocardia brasiliensis TaxID=37326 RepID=UPI0024542EC2|nr:methyltransferase [Nocardia brasiliensis]